MLEKLYQSTKYLTSGAGSIRWFYFKPWDCVYYTSTKTGGIMRVFKDGTAVRSSSTTLPDSSNLGYLKGGGLFTWTRSGSSGNYSYNFYKLNEFTGLRELTPFSTQTGKSFSLYSMRVYVDIDRDILLRGYETVGSSPDKLQARKFSNLDEVLWTMDVPDKTFCLSYVDDRTVMVSFHPVTFVSSGTGVAFVDYTTQEVKLSSKIGSHLAACYDCKCGVIIALNVDYSVSIWHPTPVPNKFTGPVLTPGTVSLYKGNKVTATLLGDMNEPCEGWWIRWRLQNGIGALSRAATKTNADGIAENYYFGPKEDIFINQSERIIAEVLY